MRNQIKVPYSTTEEVCAAYKSVDLAGFLKLYYSGLSVLVTSQDFYDITYAQLKRSAQDKAIYVEFYLSLQSLLERGIDLGVFLGGVEAAISAQTVPSYPFEVLAGSTDSARAGQNLSSAATGP